MTQKEIAYLTEIIHTAIQRMQLIGSGENFGEIYNTVDAKQHYIQGASDVLEPIAKYLNIELPNISIGTQISQRKRAFPQKLPALTEYVRIHLPGNNYHDLIATVLEEKPEGISRVRMLYYDTVFGIEEEADPPSACLRQVDLAAFEVSTYRSGIIPRIYADDSEQATEIANLLSLPEDVLWDSGFCVDFVIEK